MYTDPDFVDTNDASYASSMNYEVPLTDDDNEFDEDLDYGDKAGGDNFDNPEDDNDQQEFENLDDDNEQQPGSTGNDALDAWVEFAAAKGIQVDADELDAEKFTEQDMERLTGKYYAQKYYGHVDPKIVDMAENGVNIDQYIEHRSQLLNISRQDPIQLAKSNIYNQLAKHEHELGTIKVDAQGNIAEESKQYLISEVEKRVANMGQEKLKNMGAQIQEYYKQQATELPAKMVEQQQQRYKEQMSTWNQDVETMSTEVKNYLDKQKALVVEFSGQAEKDEFVKYVKEVMTAKDDNGQQLIPLYHRLQNDPKFLIETLRLLHMNEKGFFTDIKNRERNAAFTKMSVTPVLGKNNAGKKSGEDGRFVDTSDPNYQKNYSKKR